MAKSGCRCGLQTVREDAFLTSEKLSRRHKGGVCALFPTTACLPPWAASLRNEAAAEQVRGEGHGVPAVSRDSEQR